MSALEYKPHSQTVYKHHLKIMKGCITCPQPSQLAVSVGARRRKFLSVKGRIRGKIKRNWKLEIVFPSERFA